MSKSGARHRRTKPSGSRAASVWPSGEKVTLNPYMPRWREATSRRVATFQSFMVPSAQAVARVLPFGEKARALTYSFCTRDGGISFQVVVSQNLIESSKPHVARVLPSGEK